MATKNLINRLGTIIGEQVSDAQTFTVADSAAQYTVYKKEFDFSDVNVNYKRRYHMVSVFNDGTERDLTVRTFGEIYNGTRKQLVQLDTFTATKKGATVNPDEVWYYDASGNTLAADVTDFTDGDADDVALPGHAKEEVGDYLMIGSTTSPFNQLYLELSTASTDVNTLALEYATSDGTWADIPITDFNAATFDETAAVVKVTWDLPTDWDFYDPAAVGGSNPAKAYWIRLKCTSFTSAGTQGLIKQGTIVKTGVFGVATTTDIEDCLGIEYDRIVVTIEIAGGNIGAAKTIAGAGGFTGWVAVTAI